MEAEVHIAGLIIQALSQNDARLAAEIERLPGVEIRAGVGAGKLVVVCEGGSIDEIAATMDRLRDLPGVLNVALVYQHVESAAAMEEEIGHENDPPGIH